MTLTYAKFGNGKNTSVFIDGQHTGRIREYSDGYRFILATGERNKSFRTMDEAKADVARMVAEIARWTTKPKDGAQ